MHCEHSEHTRYECLFKGNSTAQKKPACPLSSLTHTHTPTHTRLHVCLTSRMNSCLFSVTCSQYSFELEVKCNFVLCLLTCSRPPKPRTASTPELRAVDRSSMQENSMQRHQSQNDRRTTPQMNGHLHPSPRFNNYETLTTTVERREERTEPPPPPPPPIRDKVEVQSGGYNRGRRNPPVGRYPEETSRQESTLQTGPRDNR